MSADTANSGALKWFLRFAVLILLPIVFVLPGGEHLLLGWLYFPIRTIPRITINTPAAVLGVINLLGFFIGLHIALRWLTRSTLTSQTASNVSWRSTLTISCTLLLMFAAGTAMVGATHQLIWLLVGRSTKSTSAPEPVFGIIHAARSSARMMQASNDLKQMAMGVQNFHDTFQALPPGGTITKEGEMLHGWASFTGPFNAFSCDRIDYSIPWNQSPNAQFYKCNLRMFVNPAIRGPYFDEQGFGLSHFAGNSCVLPIRTINVKDLPAKDRHDLPMRQLLKTNQTMNMSQITDGATNTLLLGTVTQRFKPWGHPANIRDPSLGIDRSPDGFGGPPSWSGAVFSFCDGHTALINRKVDPRVLHQLATPSGGEPPVAGY